jgi:hypothetical protein
MAPFLMSDNNVYEGPKRAAHCGSRRDNHLDKLTVDYI